MGLEHFRPMHRKTAHGLACVPLVLTMGVLGWPFQKPTLQLLSPTNGTAIAPGQRLTVRAVARGRFKTVTILGRDPLISEDARSQPPYVFTIAVPSDAEAGMYFITAVGATMAGEEVESNSVNVEIERADNPVVRVFTSTYGLDLIVGEKKYLGVTAKFTDGSTDELTGSQKAKLTSENAKIATVDQDNGQVTATGVGSTWILLNGKRAAAIIVHAAQR